MTIQQMLFGISGALGYLLQRSVRLRASVSAYFNRTVSVAGNRQIFTWSGWVKKSQINTIENLLGTPYNTASVNSTLLRIGNDTIQFATWDGGVQTGLVTSANLLRDPSAWYHIVISVNTTQATAANRIRIYVNGVEVAYSAPSYPAQNYNTYINSATTHYSGVLWFSTGGAFAAAQAMDGYLTELNFIDGQQLTPTSFGEFNTITGVWQPIKYAGTYGTNGFYLNFNDNSAATAAAIGKDSSGNGNNWTPNNISVTAGITYDSMTDVPTLTSATQANYPTFNPNDTGGGSVTLSGGNLNYSIAASTGSQVRGTMGTDLTSKWYWEYTAGSAATPTNPQVFGISTVDGPITNNSTSLRLAAVIYTDGGTNYIATKYINGTGTSITTQFRSVAIGDILQIAYDAATGNLWFGKNNTWYDATNGTTGNPSTGANPVFTLPTGSQMTPFLSNLGATYSGSLNCGQRAFSYTPPTSFIALNSFNLPDSTITNGSNQFAATLWTGNGSNPRNITGLNFQPDFVWVKARNAGVSHLLNDSVRGFGTTKTLASNLTSIEGATGANGAVSAALSNGFTVAAGATDSANVNNNTVTYVGWSWKGGGSAVTNTSGSITSQVSANTTAGFSIVTYTGTGANATVGHGLGVAPAMIIVKSRSVVVDWAVYHKAIGNTGAIFLNLTSATNTNIVFWNNTTPTSSVFNIGINVSVNQSAATYVAYAFAEIPGFSKFGSYTGNGSANGPFVYTGFEPRFVIVKRSDSTGGWTTLDSSRDPYNVASQYLFAETSAAEGSVALEDFLSNGFKLRSTSTSVNTNTGTYIYMAFAENPFKNTLAR